MPTPCEHRSRERSSIRWSDSAAELPWQLEPCLRRIAFRTARRRFAAWLGATSGLLLRDLEQLLLKRRIN